MNDVELTWLQWIHDRFGGIQSVARVLTELGGEIWIFFLIAFVFFAVDKEKGERLGVTVTVCGCLNEVLKLCFRRPRPFSFDSSLTPEPLRQKYADTYSFPSGHSQNGGAMYMSLLMSFRNGWVRALGIVAIVLVPITRLLLGVHFPTDVVVGTALGVAFAVAFSFLLDRFRDRRDTLYLAIAGSCFLIVLAIFLPLSFFTNVSFSGAKIFGAAAGLTAGLVLEHRFGKMPPPGVWYFRALRLLLALACAGTLLFGLKALFSLWTDHFAISFVRYFLTIGITMGVIPIAIRKLGI